jgi:hypothetical protein
MLRNAKVGEMLGFSVCRSARILSGIARRSAEVTKRPQNLEAVFRRPNGKTHVCVSHEYDSERKRVSERCYAASRHR